MPLSTASSVAAQKKKWTRVCGRRVKTGCRTCKIRRIKCDEHKPECFRCQISDRQCDGYEHPDALTDRRLRGHHKATRDSSSASSTTGSPPPFTMIDLDIGGGPDERRSFYHFKVRTAEDLSGSFQSNFWNRLVLQLSHSEPAIKHALVALGAAHETYQAGGVESVENPGLALQQYNRAISCLKAQLSTPSSRNTDVALICCVLFICFESIRCNYDAALLHIASGIEILKTQRLAPARHGINDDNEIPYLDPATDGDDIIELFTRLDVSASAFLDTELPLLPIRLADAFPSTPTMEPFPSLAAARQKLQKLVNLTLYILITHYQYRGTPHLLPAEAEIERTKLMAAVQLWATQFNALLQSPTMVGLSGRDLQAAFTLIVQQKTIAIMLEASPFSDYRILTLHEEEVEMILAIAAWVVSPAGASQPFPSSWSPFPAFASQQQQSHIDPALATIDPALLPSSSSSSSSSYTTPPSYAPSFSADMAIIPPLYYLSMNHPNLALRRRAIAILASSSRREGLWDSMLIARIAERTMEKESQGILRGFMGSVSGLAKVLGAHPGGVAA